VTVWRWVPSILFAGPHPETSSVVLPARVLLCFWVATSYSLRHIGAWRSCRARDLATAYPQVRTDTTSAERCRLAWTAPHCVHCIGAACADFSGCCSMGASKGALGLMTQGGQAAHDPSCVVLISLPVSCCCVSWRPAGGLFEWVSCPHYLAEIIIYFGLWTASQGQIMPLLMLVWVVSECCRVCCRVHACVAGLLPATACLLLSVDGTQVALEPHGHTCLN
jgi:hypothetical protein